MPLSAVVQPGAGDEVRLIEKSPVGPQLIVDVGGAFLAVQVDRNVPDGAELAASFVRQLVPAAMRFARCCEGDEDDQALAPNFVSDQEGRSAAT